MRRGDAERDPGGSDLVLGAHEPLLHRLLRDQEGATDLLGRQAAECPQGERDLRIQRERWVAAGEDELEAFVGNRRILHLVLRGFGHLEQPGLGGERAVTPDAVDRAVAGRRHQPRPRVRRRPLPRPALRGGREGLLRGFLGEVEVAEEADQGGEDASPLVAEDLFEAQ